jgi:branched-chain amino acid transport system permease protein
MSFLIAQFLTGLASASSLFLVASGLSIIFGVTRIVNFAHGSFYMLGAYMAYSLTAALMPALGGGGFWLGVLLAALVAGLLGVAMEVLLLRRLYRSAELFPLLATFGVVLVVQDAALALWGPEDLLGPRAPGFSGSVEILGVRLPEYDLVLIAAGPLVLGLLWLLFHRSRWGVLLRAATQDREMVAALGVDQKRLFTGVLFLGAALAGLGGALQLPREAVGLGMDMNIIVEAFVVVVVGGMGSIAGAFLAALLIGELSAFGILVFPQITLVLVFLAMAVVLVVRPQGLLGRAEQPATGGRTGAHPPLRPGGPMLIWAGAGLLAALAVLPLAAGDFMIGVITEILIFALFAASLQFLMGIGGMISFGHAAYLGLGAYGAALLVKHFALPMEGALFAAPLAAGLGALVFGWFCVRLSGVYLAMLTLAFAQITWSAAFQWTALTGGDNGILGVWPSPWAAAPAAFYVLTLVLVAAALVALRRAAFAPFGYALRAGRDSPLRAEAIGIDLHRQRWLGFTLAGVFAGLAGGLYAFLKGSVFPGVLAIPTSVDALVMVLLGGVQALTGPLAGAAIFTGLKAELVSLTDLWRASIGLIIIVLVVAFPQGLMGAAARFRPAGAGEIDR